MVIRKEAPGGAVMLHLSTSERGVAIARIYEACREEDSLTFFFFAYFVPVLGGTRKLLLRI